MIIDFHTHTFPDEIAARAIKQLAECAQIVPATDGTNSGLQASMKQANITISVIMPIATRKSQVTSINDWAIAVNNNYPGLRAFGTLHPQQSMAEWQHEINRLAAAGIRGVKMHPDYQTFFIDDPTVFGIFQALADAGLLLMLHAGVDIGYPDPVHCPPQRLAKMLDAVPACKVIAAHMGGYAQWDEVEKYLIGRNLFLDTCYSQIDLGNKRMSDLIRAHGSNKILFGTDSPWVDQATAVAGIHSLPLTSEEKEAILGENGRLLLNY